ncbi:hypothetical protein [Methanococcoides sp. AM1]|uniref:hypothetical protein n=1 Tax=Methanococcoides sp. AM1 TaxID=1201011 RepID=UPI001082948C|nr:hypothetical protein [Methanococcoides sp. AM1]
MAKNHFYIQNLFRNFKLVKDSWINAFLAELEQFSEGAQDDQVDALSGAASMLMQKKKFLSYAVLH